MAARVPVERRRVTVIERPVRRATGTLGDAIKAGDVKPMTAEQLREHDPDAMPRTLGQAIKSGMVSPPTEAESEGFQPEAMPVV
jgi:hypothetical protein